MEQQLTNPSLGSDSFNGYYLGIDAPSDQVVLVRMGSGSYYQIASSSVVINPDTEYHLKVVAQGSSIKVYVNDVLYIDATDSTWTSGAIGMRSYFAHAHFDNIVVSN